MATPHSNPEVLTAAQARFVRRAVALRRKLATRNLAKRLNVSPSTIRDYASGRRGRRYL